MDSLKVQVHSLQDIPAAPVLGPLKRFVYGQNVANRLRERFREAVASGDAESMERSLAEFGMAGFQILTRGPEPHYKQAEGPVQSAVGVQDGVMVEFWIERRTAVHAA